MDDFLFMHMLYAYMLSRGFCLWSSYNTKQNKSRNCPIIAAVVVCAVRCRDTVMHASAAIHAFSYWCPPFSLERSGRCQRHLIRPTNRQIHVYLERGFCVLHGRQIPAPLVVTPFSAKTARKKYSGRAFAPRSAMCAS